MTKTVPVISWVYWNGDEQGGGGFDWYPPRYTKEELVEEFNREKRFWGDQAIRIRLVMVPDVPDDLDGESLTNYLDRERLSDIEEDLTSERVFIQV